MMIRAKKIIRGSYLSMALVFLLLIGVESELEEQEALIASLVDSGEINHEMAKSLRSNCRHELLHAKKILQDLEFCFVKERSISEVLLNGGTSRIKTNDAPNPLCPQVKQILLNCLREKSRVLPITGEKKDFDTWYTRYSGSLYYSSKRRELAQKSGEESSNSQTIIIAVGATACITFFVAGLLFYCCFRSSIAPGMNDERPLLSLSLSDNSVASSRKSYGVGSEEKLGNQSFNSFGNQSFNSLSHNKSSGSLYMQSHSLSNSKIESPLVPTAEVADSSVEIPAPVPPVGAPAFPPLKPPPGRIIPPASPVKGAPTPAPPPAPTPAPPPAPAPPRPPAPVPPPPPAAPGPPAMRAPPPPPPPGMRPAGGPCPPPPPPLKGGPRPPAPPGSAPRPPSMLPKPRRPVHPSIEEVEAGASKTKLKPFFWDKVLANPDDSMVWGRINDGSFQFNEEMIESLFGYTTTAKSKIGTKKESSSPESQIIQIIDSKKAQNLSILLKALNVTTQEVCDALEEGNELPPELVQTLLKMAPTAEEELKLRLYSGDMARLGPAERFLKVVVDIPFSFKRLETLSFMCALEEESSALKEAFVVLEAACAELKKSRLFLKLLEAVLKTGNRMNSGTFRGGAQAFKLDTLLKLSDVKGIDGKTTLLHFVVLEIIRSEGIRAARAARELRSMSSFQSEDLAEYITEDPAKESEENLRSLGLQVVSCVGSELENVKRAAVLDVDNITGTVAKLGHALLKAKNFLSTDMMTVEEDRGFHQALKSFVEHAEVDVRWLLEEERRVTALIKSTADYFHGNAVRDEGFRLFLIVRDFLIILDKVCKEVKSAPPKPPGVKTPKKEETSSPQREDKHEGTRRNAPMPDPAQKLQLAIANSQPDSSSSDSSDTSDSSSSDDASPKPPNVKTPKKQGPQREDEPKVTTLNARRNTSMPDPAQKLQVAIANSRTDSSDSSDSSSDSSSSDDEPHKPPSVKTPNKGGPPKKEEMLGPQREDEPKGTTSMLDPAQKLQLAIANSRPDSSDSSDSSSDSSSSDDAPHKPPSVKTPNEGDPPKKEEMLGPQREDEPKGTTLDARRNTSMLDPAQKLQLAIANSRPDSSDSSDSSSDSSSSDNAPHKPPSVKTPNKGDPPKKEEMLGPQREDEPKGTTSDARRNNSMLDPAQKLQLAIANSRPDSSDSSDSSSDSSRSDDAPHKPPSVETPNKGDPPKKEEMLGQQREDEPKGTTADARRNTLMPDPAQKLQLAIANSRPYSLDSLDSSSDSSSSDDAPYKSPSVKTPNKRDPPKKEEMLGQQREDETKGTTSDARRNTSMPDPAQKLQLAIANSRPDSSDSSDSSSDSSTSDVAPHKSPSVKTPNKEDQPKKEGTLGPQREDEPKGIMSDARRNTSMPDPAQKLQLAIINSRLDSSDSSDSSNGSSSDDAPHKSLSVKTPKEEEKPGPQREDEPEGTTLDARRNTPMPDPVQKLRLAMANSQPDSSDSSSSDDD